MTTMVKLQVDEMEIHLTNDNGDEVKIVRQSKRPNSRLP